jgi:hypothetical protein
MERFNAGCVMIVHDNYDSGVNDAQLPSDAIRAVDSANALDKTRFAQFLVDCRNGLLPGLDTVNEFKQEQRAMLQYNPSKRISLHKYFFVPRLENLLVIQATSKKSGGGGDPNTTKKGESDGSNKKKGSGKRPSDGNRRYT